MRSGRRPRCGGWEGGDTCNRAEVEAWHASRATRVRTLSGHYSPTGLWIAREQEMSERRLSLLAKQLRSFVRGASHWARACGGKALKLVKPLPRLHYAQRCGCHILRACGASSLAPGAAAGSGCGKIALYLANEHPPSAQQRACTYLAAAVRGNNAACARLERPATHLDIHSAPRQRTRQAFVVQPCSSRILWLACAW